ncbi:MAG: PD40 domain-containing protein [Gemmatimonadales bacterium]|nr:MAG: PD40 domain-containing protein [Gemmatimonadales bacterium]
MAITLLPTGLRRGPGVPGVGSRGGAGFVIPLLLWTGACAEGWEGPRGPTGWVLDSAAFVVTGYVDGDPEIFLVRNRFDTLWTRVTDRPGLDNSATWSADGEWIVFHSDRTSTAAPDLDLFLVNPEGRVPPVPLTFDPGLDYLPHYSPDGQYISFLSRRDSAEASSASADEEEPLAHIYLLEVVGRTARRVTRYPVNASLGATWMPDGESLLGARRLEPDGPTHLVRIWLDLDRSASLPLGVREQVLVADAAFNYTPVPSPDGSRIAYTAESGGAARVVVMDLASGERRTLTESGHAYVDTWTPDGNWIAVTRWDPKDDRREVWLVDPDGEEPDEPLLRGSNRPASDVAFRPVRR